MTTDEIMELVSIYSSAVADIAGNEAAFTFVGREGYKYRGECLADLKSAIEDIAKDRDDARRYRWLFNDVDLAAIEQAFANNQPLPVLHGQVIEQIIGFYTNKRDADILIDAAMEAEHDTK